jgi:hypothetical protein
MPPGPCRNFATQDEQQQQQLEEVLQGSEDLDVVDSMQDIQQGHYTSSAAASTAATAAA